MFVVLRSLRRMPFLPSIQHSPHSSPKPLTLTQLQSLSTSGKDSNVDKSSNGNQDNYNNNNDDSECATAVPPKLSFIERVKVLGANALLGGNVTTFVVLVRVSVCKCFILFVVLFVVFCFSSQLVNHSVYSAMCR
jgi:hypothetical protein